MIIFSERVNGMYRDVRGAIKERDKQIVQDLVKEQLAGGADLLILRHPQAMKTIRSLVGELAGA